jgi:autotransporter-associated beta strand protein
MNSSTSPRVAASSPHNNNDSLRRTHGTAARFRSVGVVLAVAVVCSIVLFPCTLLAQTTWGNTGTEWTSGASWVGGAAPANSIGTVGNTAVFSNLAVGFNNVNLSSDRRIYGVLFSAEANAYTFTGSSLAINGAYGITNSSANVQTFSNKVMNASSNTTYGSYTAGGSLVFVGGIDLTDSGSANSRTLTLGGSGDITVSGSIANGGTATAGAVIITNTALTTLSGNNTYGGATTVNSGATLRLGSATALGATNGGTTVNAGGQLQLSGGITVDGEALSLVGGGGSVASLLNVSGNNFYNGTISFSTTNVRIDSAAGTLVLGSFATGNALTGSRSLFVGGSGNTIFNGTITGSSSSTITKDGSGILTLSNTWISASSGGTVVADGTLRLGINQAITNNLRVTGSGATLDLGEYSTTVGAVTLSNGTITGTTGILTGTSYAVENGTISAILGGTGSLTKSGSGTVTLSGANTYSGTTTIGAGTLRLNGTNALATSGSIFGSTAASNNSTLELAGGGDYVLSAFGSTNANGGNIRFTNSSGSAATLTFTAATNYVTRGSASAGGRTVANNSTDLGLIFNGAVDIGSTDSNNVTFGGAGNTTVKGVIFNTNTAVVRGLTKTGTGTLSLEGANSYNGPTTVSAGSLIVASTGSLSSSAVSISNGATFRYNGSSSLAASITVGGDGVGRAVLGGTGTINSAVALNSLNDVLSPGNSPGIQSFTPNQTWSSFTYDWELNNFTGTTAGTAFDQISIAGSLDLLPTSSYTLNVISLTAGNVAGDVPNFTEVDTSWIILTASGGISGFDSGDWLVDTNSFSALGSIAGRFTISQSGNNLNLNYVVPEPSTYALLGVSALACGAWFVRRRRKS